MANSEGVLLPPPRRSGVDTNDLIALFNWANDLFQTVSSTRNQLLQSTATVTKPLHVYLAEGQSNIIGAGGQTGDTSGILQPKLLVAKSAFKFYHANIFDADELNEIAEGDWIPAFGNVYFRMTGVPVMVVCAGVGGSGQQAATDTGNGTWDVTGDLITGAVRKLDRAMIAAIAAGYTPTFRGVISAQGEQDAVHLAGGTPGVTFAGYKISLTAKLAKYRSLGGYFTETTPFFLFRLGSTNTVQNAWDLIRQGQEDVISLDPYSRIIYRETVDFHSRGWLNSIDHIHYTQPGLNHMGAAGARSVVEFISADPEVFEGRDPSAFRVHRFTDGSVVIGGEPGSARSGGLDPFAGYLFMLAGAISLFAGTTDCPSLVMPEGVAPTSPSEGQVWRVGDQWFMRGGGTTKSITFT